MHPPSRAKYPPAARVRPERARDGGFPSGSPSPALSHVPRPPAARIGAIRARWAVATCLLLGTNCATHAEETRPAPHPQSLAIQQDAGGAEAFDGWKNEALRPQNRTARLAVSPDGSRLALVWQHNADGKSAFTGEPTTYATVASRPGSFGPVMAIGRAPFRPLLPFDLSDRLEYHVRHNEPIVVALPGGRFLALSMPMVANGYAVLRPPTGYAYVQAEYADGAWSEPGLARLRETAPGSSLSEMSGDADPDGNVHLFGQGHLGGFQGGMGYQRRSAGENVWDSVNLAAAYRPTRGMAYFAEGWGYVSGKRNGLGKFDLHVAFAWNRQGWESELYGLYYLVSHDGGRTWLNVDGQPARVPLEANSNDRMAAIVPAALGTRSYSGNQKGARGISVTAGPDGEPLIVRSTYVSDTTVQNRLYTRVKGAWISVPVGGPLFWNFHRTHVSYNHRTGRVNVVLLDPGSTMAPGRVLLFSQPLADVRAGKSAWTQEVVAQAANTRNYASSLQVAAVSDTRFEILFEPSYQNPGRVAPVLVQAAMR